MSVKVTTYDHYLHSVTIHFYRMDTPRHCTDAVRKVFHSGIDYWQRKHHIHHSRAMKHVKLGLLLMEQRSDAQQALVLQQQHELLPAGMWLEVCTFLPVPTLRALTAWLLGCNCGMSQPAQ